MHVRSTAHVRVELGLLPGSETTDDGVASNGVVDSSGSDGATLLERAQYTVKRRDVMSVLTFPIRWV